MTDQAELMPCPFCGGEGMITRMAGSKIGTFCYQPYCAVTCGCCIDNLFDTEAQAAAAWNMRSQPDSGDGLRETLTQDGLGVLAKIRPTHDR